MSSVVPVDRAERERIRTDLATNLCVEAGAGTGKTTVLVERVAEVLRSGAATVDEIAVITFTEAAAAELAARVRHRLERALTEAADGEGRERIAQALGELHRAHIETIHAFAASLLRERPVEARLDPGFEVLDGFAAQLAFDAAYEDWLRDLLAEERPEVAAAVRRGFDLRQLRRLVEAVHAHRSLLPLTPAAPPAVDASGLIARLADAAAHCRELLLVAGDDEAGIADLEAIARYAESLAAVRDDPSELDRELLYRAPHLKPNRGRKDDWDDPARAAESKALRAEVRDAIAHAQAALRSETIVALLPLAEQFVAGYEAQRKREGRADFDDLLEWARDLLAESREAREYFRRRFRVVVVDEFQDTDPVQADLALCLASDGEPGTDWLELPPRPGGLTVVGDPKQSIYRFRRADIAVYDAVRRGPLAGGDVRLVQNFRSVDGVLRWANELFDRVLVEREGVQPGNTPLVAGDAALADESLSVCVVHGEAADDSAAAVRAEEARLLATTIRTTIEEGWPVRDRETGVERPATYGDVVVLLPRRTALDTYLDAFRRASVPVRGEGGRSFFQRQEVLDLANLLFAIDDPLDQLALVASLRSSVFACSDEELYLHRAAGHRFDYRLDCDDSPASVREALALLRDLHGLRSRVSLGRLVRVALERTRLVEIALAGWDGEQAAANLVKLAERARAFSASGAGGLRAFARWLAEQRAASDEAEANVAEETDEVVRVLTIHAAKGLEFPVVALANLGARSRSDLESVPDRRGHRLHLRVKAGDHEFATPGFAEAWEHEREQREAEEKRLLYVAVTRARDRLIVPVASRPTKGSLLSDFLPSLPGWDEAAAGAQVGRCYLVDRRTLPSLPEDEPPLPGYADAEAVSAAIAERAAWHAGRTALGAAARAELAVHPATKDEGDEPVPAALAGADEQPLVAGGGESPPRLKGEALHRALELVDLGYATGRIDLVFREGDELVVADWKSDAVGPGSVAAAAEAHRPQAEAYVRALRAATGMRVREIVFVFPRAGAEAALEVD